MGRQHGQRDPLPRWGYCIGLGLLALWLGGSLATNWPGHVHMLFGSSLSMTRAALFVVGAIIGFIGSRLFNLLVARFFGAFNTAFDAFGRFYGRAIRAVLRFSPLMLCLYGSILALTYFGFRMVPNRTRGTSSSSRSCLTAPVWIARSPSWTTWRKLPARFLASSTRSISPGSRFWPA
jgi:hypothetical protein